MRPFTISLLAVIASLFCFNANLFAASTATLVGTDTVTLGSWVGTYGTSGYYIPNGPSVTPSDGSTFSPGAVSSYTWGTNVTSGSALKTGAVTNIASCWFKNLGTSSPSISLDVTVPSGQSQTVAVYFLDYDKQGRAESVSVTDPSNAPLSGPTAVSGSNFINGEYLVWTITGEVHINITLVSGPNAVAGGIFFGQSTSMPPPVTTGAYYTEFIAFPASTLAAAAKLTLPAGTYIIRATANLQEDALGVGALFAGCRLFHTNTDYSNQIHPAPPAVIMPTITLAGGYNLAAGSVTEEARYVSTAQDVIIWACSDGSGNGSQVTAIGTLTAEPYATINVQ